ncbi:MULTISPECIES: formylmethanofuran dehydrogenase subunit E family protein [unclassified Methanoculleus]|jgi:formylmethanofuran dehydrogenase subunit E|uniref:formylmethanofuran dehydrogenase subunit E family protein n=1 Tax=unclassified Methanoculleus TaxID=2619537 RepID=UPI0025E668F3|nr:formylmethanofuran dehydrogenase subunit E family protein [Methanoculleus sp. UBA377]
MDAETHSHCKYYNIKNDFSVADLAAFHGHLGPYIVLGYRIGKYVRSNFCGDPFRMKARVHCAGTPPQSCLADGVQLGSGCTLGKRNIEIVPSETVACVFEAEGRKITVIPRPFPLPKQDMDYEASIEAVAEEMYCQRDDELFDLSSS